MAPVARVFSVLLCPAVLALHAPHARRRRICRAASLEEQLVDGAAPLEAVDVSAVAPTGPGGKTAKVDGTILWQWWWEHNKDRFLAKATTPGRINAGSAVYWFGAGAKYPPREIIPVSDAQIKDEIFKKLKRMSESETNAAVLSEVAVALGRTGFVAAVQTKDGDSNNLIALCNKHHRTHHQGRLGITGHADDLNGVRFTNRHGQPIRASGARPKPPGERSATEQNGTPYRPALRERLESRWQHFNPPQGFRPYWDHEHQHTVNPRQHTS